MSAAGVPTGQGTVAVIFGGPSPEHDVSVLTGLQAARALVTAGRAGVEAVYWTKGERFVAVEPTLEASAFLEGAPKGARELRFVAQPGGGFFLTKPGVLGAKERRLELDALVNCCHGGPGEDGTLQAALDLAGVAYTGPAAAAAALCMDKLAFGGVVQGAGLPALPRKLVVPGREAPNWDAMGGAYIVKPRFGGSSIGIEVIEDWADVVRYAELGGPHTVRGVVAEPFRGDAYDVNVSVRAYPALALSLFDRPLRPAGAGPILSYSDKYLGGQGMVSAPRELPAQLAPGLEKELRDAATTVAVLAGGEGRLAHRFPGRGRRAVVGKRGQHHSRLSGEVPLVRRGGRRFPHLVGRHDRGGAASPQCPLGVHGRRRLRPALGGGDSQQARLAARPAGRRPSHGLPPQVPQPR